MLTVEHDTSPKAAARRQVFRKRIPRNKWLCANDDRFGEHSLRTYFGRTPRQKVWELVKSMGREKRIRFGNEQMFRADAAQGYGANLRWVAFGLQRPQHDVASQLDFFAKDDAAPASEVAPPAALPPRKKPSSTRRSPRLVRKAPSSNNDRAEAPAEPPEYMRRMGNRPHAEQTASSLWTWGQLQAVIMFVNNLPKGSITQITQQPAGLCQKITLHLRNGTKHVIWSAEYVGQKCHPNLRYHIATLTVPGMTNAIADRTVSELGLAHAPAKSATYAARKEVMKAIKTIAQKSVDRARAKVAEKAAAESALQNDGEQDEVPCLFDFDTTPQATEAACKKHMAVCEINDGPTWLKNVDDWFGLKPLAHQSRSDLQARRAKDKKRKAALKEAKRCRVRM